MQEKEGEYMTAEKREEYTPTSGFVICDHCGRVIFSNEHFFENRNMCRCAECRHNRDMYLSKKLAKYIMKTFPYDDFSLLSEDRMAVITEAIRIASDKKFGDNDE